MKETKTIWGQGVTRPLTKGNDRSLEPRLDGSTLQAAGSTKKRIGPAAARKIDSIILDIKSADRSNGKPTQSRGYELGLKGYELYTNGKQTEKVPPG